MNINISKNKFRLEIKRDKLIAICVFVALGFISIQLPINSLAGSSVKFTFFDLFAPTAGVFLGAWFGVFAVLLMQALNIVFTGQITEAALIRLLPTLFAVWFFAKKDIKFLVIPLLAIVSFNLNDVGRSVWYYSMFWLVPIAVFPAIKKSLAARALASTFVAHSVGGAIWIWSFNIPASVWHGLIPVVALERGIMALGICASYLLINNVVNFLINKKLAKNLFVDKQNLLIK